MNEKLKKFEISLTGKVQKKEAATHIVCGIFVRLEYTLAQFPTTGNKMAIHYFYQVCLAIPGQELYDIIWSTI